MNERDAKRASARQDAEDARARRHSAGVARRLAKAMSYVLVGVAVAVAAFPFVADLYGHFLAEREFTEAVSTARGYDAAQVQAQLQQAAAYNEGVSATRATSAARSRSQAEASSRTSSTRTASYDEQLTLDDDDILCWLEIPQLSLKIPVYRGSDDPETVEKRLMEGAVHMRETSLPVGGKSTHAGVEAHSGMRNARMFDEIDKLRTGDRFKLWVYGKELVYEVYAQETVDPDAVLGKLAVKKDADLVTLVTCRPVGVNTQRLLVHAKRVDDSKAGEGDGSSSLPRTGDLLLTPRFLMFAAAVALALATISATVVARVRRLKADKPDGRMLGGRK